MRTIGPLFGRSPFGPLKQHMEKVAETWAHLRPFFEAFLAGRGERCREIRKIVLKLEHEADLVKNDIRDHLPRSLFLMVDRRDLLALLHEQDSLADLCEDIVVVASLREQLSLPETLQPGLLRIVDQALDACAAARELIGQLDGLVEASFGGPEAERVLEMIRRIGQLEYEVDKSIYSFARELFRHEETLGPVALMLWQKILQLLGDLANRAEGIGDDLRLMLYR